jgi:hypothetical protein
MGEKITGGTRALERPQSGFVGAVSQGDSLDIVAKNGHTHRFTLPLGPDLNESLSSLYANLHAIDAGTHWRTIGIAGLNGGGREFAAKTWSQRGISTVLFDAGADSADVLDRVVNKHSPHGIRQVEIDSDGRVHSARLGRWTDYKPFYPEDTWNEKIGVIKNEAKVLEGTLVIDRNTTVQGGGVAGKDHPKQRFVEDLNEDQRADMAKGNEGHTLDYLWLKMDGAIDPKIAAKPEYNINLQDPELLAKYGEVDPKDPDRKRKIINIFRLTKLRHKILQNAAEADDQYTDKDDRLYRAWCETQYERDLKPKLEQAQREGKHVILKEEDQQTAGELPLIRRDFPDREFLQIIARNHIHSHGRRATDSETPIGAVSQSILRDMDGTIDLYMVHRSVDGDMDEFLFRDEKGNIDPRIADKVTYAVASFDQLDGLGRPLSPAERPLVHAENNDYLIQTGQSPSDFDQPALGESNRWCPSKRKIVGILGYVEFVKMMEQEEGVSIGDIPEYRSVGMGAWDDTDGGRLFAAYMLGIHPELASRPEYQKYLDPSHHDYEPLLPSDLKIIEKLNGVIEEDPRLADKIKLFRFTYDEHDDKNRRGVEETYATARTLADAEGCEDNISRFINDGIYTIVPRVGGMAAQVTDGVSGRIVEMTNDEREYRAIAEEDRFYFTQIYPDPEKRAAFRRQVKAALKFDYTTLFDVAVEFGAAALLRVHGDNIRTMINQHHAATGEYPFVHELLGEFKPEQPQSVFTGVGGAELSPKPSLNYVQKETQVFPSVA